MAKKKDLPQDIDSDNIAITSEEDQENNTPIEKKKFMELGALWASKSGNGFVGQLTDGTRVLLMKNEYKTESKHPDFRLFVLPVEGE